MTDQQTGRALGWTSIGLSVARVAAPLWLSKQLGVAERDALLRALGVREVLTGVGIPTRDNASAGLWSRIAGDVVEIAMLGLAARKSKNKRAMLGAIAAVVALGAVDLFLATRFKRSPKKP